MMDDEIKTSDEAAKQDLRDDAAPHVPETVRVACRLPSGLVLDANRAEAVPGVINDGADRFVLRGANQAETGVDYGVTAVKADFWHDWFARHRDFAPVASGAIFELPREDKAS